MAVVAILIVMVEVVVVVVVIVVVIIVVVAVLGGGGAAAAAAAAAAAKSTSRHNSPIPVSYLTNRPPHVSSSGSQNGVGVLPIHGFPFISGEIGGGRPRINGLLGYGTTGRGGLHSTHEVGIMVGLMT